MGKEATATFIGHKECYGVHAEDVRREVEKLIASGVTDFLNGGMGGFDWMCARVVFDLRKSYPQIRNWCCTIKVDIENSKGQYIEKDKQEATKDGSESTKIQHGI